jgi:hypothetical protein
MSAPPLRNIHVVFCTIMIIVDRTMCCTRYVIVARVQWLWLAH